MIKPYVHQTLTTKALHFSMGEIQSLMDIRRPDALELDYTRVMMGFLLFVPDPATVLMIGLGGGSLAKFCHRQLPSARIVVVEINPHVIALRKEFHVPEDSDRFRVVQADAAEFVRTCAQRCDVVLVDGFDYDGQPASLCSTPFYERCFDLLGPDGVLVVNLHAAHPDHAAHVERIADIADGPTLLVRDEDRTNAIVFARRGKAVALHAGHLQKPRQLDGVSWQSLKRPFARILLAFGRLPDTLRPALEGFLP